MEKKNNRKALTIIGIIGMFILVFGITYAIFQITLNGTKKVKIKTATISLRMVDKDGNDIYTLDDSYSENSSYAINLENQVPISDAEGLSQEGFTFSVINEGTIPTNYKLTIVDDIENTLGDSNIKYSLEEKDYYDKDSDVFQGITRNLKTLDSHFDGLRYVITNGYTTLDTLDNRVLDEMTILPNEKIEYVLKIWLDESATNDAMNKNFEAHIRLDGSQTKPLYSGPAGDNINYDYYPDGTLIISGEGEFKNATCDDDNDFLTIENNLNPYVDITYKILSENGIETEPLSVENYNNSNIKSLRVLGGSALLTKGLHDEYPEEDLLQSGGNFSYSERIGELIGFLTPAERTTINNILKDYKINRVVIGEGITKIGYQSLRGSGGYMISLPTTLEEIEPFSFYDSTLYDLVIPENFDLSTIEYFIDTVSWFTRADFIQYKYKLHFYNTEENVTTAFPDIDPSYFEFLK